MLNNPKEFQPWLFDLIPKFEFKSAGAARAHYGAAIEKLVCSALGLTPIPIDSKFSVNFDAKRAGQFYEIKSMRDGSGKSVIYKWRMAKEKPFADRLTYAFGLHKIRGAKSHHDLWTQLRDNGARILLVPAETVHALAVQQPLRKFKSATQSGYNRTGYKEGYHNLPVGELLKGATESKPRVADFYGHPINYTLLTL